MKYFWMLNRCSFAIYIILASHLPEKAIGDVFMESLWLRIPEWQISNAVYHCDLIFGETVTIGTIQMDINDQSLANSFLYFIKKSISFYII